MCQVIFLELFGVSFWACRDGLLVIICQLSGKGLNFISCSFELWSALWGFSFKSFDSFFSLFLAIFISLGIKGRVLGLHLNVVEVFLLTVPNNTFSCSLSCLLPPSLRQMTNRTVFEKGRGSAKLISKPSCFLGIFLSSLYALCLSYFWGGG